MRIFSNENFQFQQNLGKSKWCSRTQWKNRKAFGWSWASRNERRSRKISRGIFSLWTKNFSNIKITIRILRNFLIISDTERYRSAKRRKTSGWAKLSKFYAKFAITTATTTSLRRIVSENRFWIKIILILSFFEAKWSLLVISGPPR